ncbi:MAG: hypothetical protein RR268_04700 [Kiritimatiellia bacterium]
MRNRNFVSLDARTLHSVLVRWHVVSWRIGVLGAFLCLAPCAMAQGGFGGMKGLDKIGIPTLPAFDNVEITADRMGADRKTNIATLDNNVRIRFSDVTMTADHASYDSATGDVHAEGHVSIVSLSGGSWHGDTIDFNHKTGEGLFGTGVLKFGAFTVDADSYARDDDGIFYAQNATFTTCTNDESHWHWSATGTARYKDKEFIELKNAVGRIEGVPLVWMPYYYRDLNTAYGWRFMPGYTSKWGAFLKTGYVYPIAGSMEDEALLYGKTVFDVRSEYGVAIGQELTWRTEALNQWGRASIYYANHHENQDGADKNWQSSYKEHRWSLGLSERLEFSPRDTFTLTGEIVSDSQFREDYDELDVRASSQPVGIINYEHRENTWVSSLAISGPLNTFYAGTKRLPEFRLDILPHAFLGIEKLYYESQTSVGYFERQPAKFDNTWDMTYQWQPGNWAYYDSFRFDTRHILRRPFTLAEGVTLTPRAGWRGTYWSDSPDSATSFRSLFELGTTLQARYWKDFNRFRHTFIPYLDLTYVPASEETAGDQHYAFDRIDREYEWRDRYRTDGLTPSHRYAGVRFGLKNILQNRTALGFSKLLDVDLYGIYVAQSQDEYVRWTHRMQPGRDAWRKYPARRIEENEGLRVLGLNGTYTPFSNFEIANDFQYDPTESRLALWDINARYHLSAVTLYVGYLTRHHEVYDYYWSDTVKDSITYAGFIHRLCDTISWSAYGRWNLSSNDLEEVGGFVQYNLDCISLRMNTGYLPSYTSEDGYSHDSDVRFSVEAWLRAFPNNTTEEWMTWGNLSNSQDLGIN